MRSKNVWMRLLALMLVAGLMLGCLAGCGGESTGSSSGSDKKKDEAKAEKLREGLEEHEFEGLLLYLDEDMALGNYGFSNMDGSLTIHVDMSSPDELEEMAEEYDVEITSAKTMLEALLKSAEEADVTILDSGKKNGAYFIDYEVSWDDETYHYVMGLYYEDGYAWTVDVEYEDEEQKDTAVKYATICQVDSDFDPSDYEDEELDYEENYGDYNENVDGY